MQMKLEKDLWYNSVGQFHYKCGILASNPGSSTSDHTKQGKTHLNWVHYFQVIMNPVLFCLQ